MMLATRIPLLVVPPSGLTICKTLCVVLTLIFCTSSNDLHLKVFLIRGKEVTWGQIWGVTGGGLMHLWVVVFGKKTVDTLVRCHDQFVSYFTVNCTAQTS
jgi:hypothetical protein